MATTALGYPNNRLSYAVTLCPRLPLFGYVLPVSTWPKAQSLEKTGLPDDWRSKHPFFAVVFGDCD